MNIKNKTNKKKKQEKANLLVFYDIIFSKHHL